MPETTTSFDGLCLLDDIQEQLIEGHFRPALNQLCRDLQGFRHSLSREEWRRFCQEDVSRHRLTRILREGPITRLCFEKPRGYTPDPVALDLLYEVDKFPSGLTSLSTAMLSWERSLSFADSLRDRRCLLQKELEETLRTAVHPRILAVAGGYLRELSTLSYFANSELGIFAAFDSDPKMLELVAGEYHRFNIQPISGSLDALNPTLAGYFHFIYAPNLLETLDQCSARRLVTALMNMLEPNGRILLGNFATDMTEAAYLEACMDWWPVYRSEHEMAELASGIAEFTIAAQCVFRDARGANIVFLEIQRGGS